MPPLGQDFIDHLSRLITAQRPDLAPVDAATLLQAFESFGHRPQFFMKALGQALSPLSGLQGVRFEQAVLQAAKACQQSDEAQIESDYLALKPMEVGPRRGRGAMTRPCTDGSSSGRAAAHGRRLIRKGHLPSTTKPETGPACAVAALIECHACPSPNST